MFDHKAFDGILLPTRITDVRDGVQILPENKVEYKFPEKIDLKEFEKPTK